jgi:hypothetical protein
MLRRISRINSNLYYPFRLVLFLFFYFFIVKSQDTQDTTAARHLGDLLDFLSSTPPDANKALKLCDSGKLPSSGSTRVGSGTGSSSLDEFVLSRLSFNAEIINVIACLVEKDVIEVNQTVDNGAKLLSTAAQRKHMRLTSALLQRNATRPKDVISDAVSNRLLVLDITQKLLTKHKSSKGEGGKKAAPPEAALTYAKWLSGLVTSMQKHLPSIEAKKPALALVSLLKNSDIVNASHSIDKASGLLKITITPLEMKRNKKNKRDPTATVSAGVALLETAEIEHVSMIANGLSALLVRVLVAGEGASPDLHSIMSLLSYTDRRGRTPLHRAAAVGNKIAAMTMISTIVSSIKSKSGSTSSISQANVLQDWISKKDITGHTSAEIACIYGHSSFAMLLIKGSGSGEGGVNESDICKTVLATILSSKSIDDTTTVTSSSSFIETKSDDDDGGWRGSGIGITAAAGLRSVARNLRTRNNGIVPNTTEEDDDSKFDFFSKFDLDCDLEIVSGVGLSPASFFKRFYSINKPVVLRGLGLDWPQRKLWKRETLFSSNASKTIFLPSQIPYGRAFGDSVGDSEKSGKATLRDYILSLDAQNGEAFGAPLYIFDSPIAASRGAAFDMSNEASQALIDDLEMVPPFLRYDIPGIKLDSDATSASINTDGTSEETNHTTRTTSSTSPLNAGLVLLRPAPSPQFYLGGPGTGSPLHFHKDAFNALMYGKKRWFLIPPASALYSTVPISTWVVNTSLDGPDMPKGLQMCTQIAGDVIYVPHGWAHGVLNLETSVGVAVEFSSVLQE